MKTKAAFNPKAPFDSLSPLPPESHLYENLNTLKLEAQARAAVSELKGLANIIPNQAILINAVVLREAKDSSAIENIITTHDEIYRAVAAKGERTADSATKEVLRYREALLYGYNKVRQRSVLTIPDIIEMQKIIVENDAGIRRTPGTSIVNDQSNETIYTPPQKEHKIRELLSNLAEYLNSNDASLIKSAIIHYQFESIHPFYDGNGRTGRIVNVLYLVLKGHLDIPILYLSSYIIENKSEYYRLLLNVTKNQDWNAWIQYYLHAVELTARKAIETVRRVRLLMDETVENVKANAPKIYSRELVETLFENPYCKNQFVERAVGVERKAASRYLYELRDIGILSMRKLGRENIFINTQLMELLRQP